MYPYSTEAEALFDVLRLSKGMSYKNALAGIPLGGGKSVIIGDPRKEKSPALLRSFAEHVNRLGGTYHTAEDVGIGMADADIMASASPFVFGVSRKGGADASGDPSPFTARGTFQGLRAATRHRLGRDTLEGLRVAVQGVGNVGMALCGFLHDAGAKLMVADPSKDRLDLARERFGASIVPLDEIMAVEADILAPCALGAVINARSIPQIKAPVIAGAANNQLETRMDAQRLVERRITFAPDYVINAGGMHNASADIFDEHAPQHIAERIDGIYDLTLDILTEAEAASTSPVDIADRRARAIIANTSAIRSQA